MGDKPVHEIEDKGVGETVLAAAERPGRGSGELSEAPETVDVRESQVRFITAESSLSCLATLCCTITSPLGAQLART
jgi:hypothetical protein